MFCAIIVFLWIHSICFFWWFTDPYQSSWNHCKQLMLFYCRIKSRTNLLEILELLVSWKSLFLSHSSMDGDSREVLLSQELSQSGTTLNRLDEDDDLKKKPEYFHFSIFREVITILGKWHIRKYLPEFLSSPMNSVANGSEVKGQRVEFGGRWP